MLSFFLSVPGGGRRWAAGSAVVFLGVSFSRLQMLGKLGSEYSFLGTDRKPQSFSLAVCCVIPLWNDGVIARSALFKLPESSPTYLENFIILSAESVGENFSSFYLCFVHQKKAAGTEMSVLSDTAGDFFNFFWIVQMLTN